MTAALQDLWQKRCAFSCSLDMKVSGTECKDGFHWHYHWTLTPRETVIELNRALILNFLCSKSPKSLFHLANMHFFAVVPILWTSLPLSTAVSLLSSPYSCENRSFHRSITGLKHLPSWCAGYRFWSHTHMTSWFVLTTSVPGYFFVREILSIVNI